jgi:hypothetical protein
MTQRTYRKNLVVVKDLDGGVIDEAFFLLKDGTNVDEDEIVREANRIIERSKQIKAIKSARPRFSLPEFFIGAAAAAIVALVLVFVF